MKGSLTCKGCQESQPTREPNWSVKFHGRKGVLNHYDKDSGLLTQVCLNSLSEEEAAHLFNRYGDAKR